MAAGLFDGENSELNGEIPFDFIGGLDQCVKPSLFGDPTLDMTAPGTFASIPITERNSPRSIQLALRLEF
jgi:hypothetical protein